INHPSILCPTPPPPPPPPPNQTNRLQLILYRASAHPSIHPSIHPRGPTTATILSQTPRKLLLRTPHLRTFTTSSVWRQTAATATPAASIPKKRPIGAFRGGCVLTQIPVSVAWWYNCLGFSWDRRFLAGLFSNELLTEDVEALRTSIQRVEAYVRRLEESIEV
ncbi:hypothetical protein C7212DRAFT_326218, partial [Tuber magnatum]